MSDLERDLKYLNFNKLSLDEQLSLEGDILVNEARQVSQNKWIIINHLGQTVFQQNFTFFSG